MSLKQKIEADLKTSLKAKEELKVSTLRFTLSAIKNEEIAKQKELTDEELVQVLQKQAKLRRESIEAFRSGGREDLVSKESQELEILNNYLPQQLTTKELEKIVSEVIEELKAGPKDFGKVMGEVMARAKGRINGTEAAQAVKKSFTETSPVN